MTIEDGQWDTTKELVENILGPKDVERIRIVREHVKRLWKGNKYQGYYTLHDPSHNEGVEYALYKLIPIQNDIIPLCASAGKKSLTPSQWFCLLSGAWLHDVGMLPDILENDEIRGFKIDDIEKARKIHHIRSSDYIHQNAVILGLSEEERDCIKVICKYHRKSVSIKKCPTENNLQLLSSYLRLADGIHINYERVDDDLFGLFQLIGIPDESRYHWIKSKLTKSIVPDPSSLSINVTFRFKVDDAADSKIVSDMIIDEIKNELYTVKNILIKGGISYYLDVNLQEKDISGDENVRVLLKQMIDSVRLDTWASATDVANCLIDAIEYLNGMDDKEKAIELLSRYQKSIVEPNMKHRTCHLIINKIFNIIDYNLKLKEKYTADIILKNIEDEVLKIKDERLKAEDTIAENARVFLDDKESMLLFGRSKFVIKALEKITDKENTPIYICEGRNSGRYSYTNDLVYCDGLEYAREVKKLGFTNVKLIPDILVGNLLARKKDGIQKIVFGANGIDIKDASFGHTAGHLTIATLAKIHDIPVYVLADSHKFGCLKYDDRVERCTQWLMGKGSQCYSKLAGIALFNPREDKVEAKYIYFLITEMGAFPPGRIPKIIRSQYDDYTKKYGLDSKSSDSLSRIL